MNKNNHNNPAYNKHISKAFIKLKKNQTGPHALTQKQTNNDLYEKDEKYRIDKNYNHYFKAFS